MHLFARFVLVLFVFLFSVSTRAVEGTKQVLAIGDMSVEIMEESGEMTFSNKSASADVAVTIVCESLKEVDFQGVNISGKTFATFANLNFTFANVTNSTYPGTSLKTESLSFNAEMFVQSQKLGDLIITAYIFESMGNVSIDDEVTWVNKGDLKFSVEVNGWTFENSGNELELTIDIKGKSSEALKKAIEIGKPEEYDLGGSTLFLSKKVRKETNGSWLNMTSTYPKYLQQGTKKLFVFRFPYGNDITYDPTISIALESAAKQTNANAILIIFFVAFVKLHGPF